MEKWKSKNFHWICENLHYCKATVAPGNNATTSHKCKTEFNIQMSKIVNSESFTFDTSDTQRKHCDLVKKQTKKTQSHQNLSLPERVVSNYFHSDLSNHRLFSPLQDSREVRCYSAGCKRALC